MGVAEIKPLQVGQLADFWGEFGQWGVAEMKPLQVGELADFLLGWTTLDVMADDIEDSNK